jgi:hypothetical protein
MRHFRVVRVVIVLVAAGLYWSGATQQADKVNTDISQGDQSAYMRDIQRYSGDPFGYVNGRNRMPMYPLLQAAVYRSDLSDEESFRRAKRFNIVLSVLLLALLYPVMRTVLTPLPAVVLLAITTFTVWVLKAGHVQAELFFYFLTFGLFLLMCRTLLGPTVWRGAATGAVAGLAHLTKASILPGFALFLLIGLLDATVRWWRGTRAWPSARLPLLASAAAALTFALVIAPYAMTSKRVFGQYLYNVNSTFYIWYDSWHEAQHGTKAHGDRRGWPDLPASEIPSAHKYFRTHSALQVVKRLGHGLQTIVTGRSGYGYDPYIVGLFGFVAIAALCRRKQLKLLVASRWPVVAFVAAYFAVYVTLYAFYAPISHGDRFVLALFLPLMVSLAAVADRTPIASWSLPVFGRAVRPWLLCNVLLAALLVAELPIILTQRVLTVSGDN